MFVINMYIVAERRRRPNQVQFVLMSHYYQLPSGDNILGAGREEETRETGGGRDGGRRSS
jgi:hypothetical protein